MKKKIAEDKGAQEFAPELQKLIYNGKILIDEQQLKDIEYAAAKFIVVMVSRVSISKVFMDVPVTSIHKDECLMISEEDRGPGRTCSRSHAGGDYDEYRERQEGKHAGSDHC